MITLRLWRPYTVHSRTKVTSYVRCYEQPLWTALRSILFHRTVCRVFGRTSVVRRFNGWPDTRCFELNELLSRCEVKHEFVLKVEKRS